jgi:serine/threonine protein kinase
MVFRGLAEALYVLTTGKLATLDSPQDHVKNEHLQTAPNWEKLVHMDIKPLNVVLAEARTQYPVFKTPQLIDFGAARTEDQFLKLSRDENATRQASGTKGYRPPVRPSQLYSIQGVLGLLTNRVQEQHHELNEHTGKLIDVRADIHNVGLIILSLIAKQAVKLDNPHDESAKRPQSNACYSEQLATLAADCVNLDPEQRPTLAKLLHRTQEGFTAYTDVYGDVAQKQMDELDRYHKMDYVTHLGADEFAVGLPMPRKRGSESANHNWSPKRPRTGEGGVAGRVREGTLRLDIDSDFQDEVDDELEYGSEGREDGSEKWEDDVERKEAEQEELGDEPEESGDEPEVPEVPEVPEKP